MKTRSKRKIYHSFLGGLIVASSLLIIFSAYAIWQRDHKPTPLNSINLADRMSDKMPETKDTPPIASLEQRNAEQLRKNLDARRAAVFEGVNVAKNAPQRNIISTTDLVQAASEDDGFINILPYKDLKLYNIHTDERIRTIFWVDGRYIPRALDRLDQFWRDWRRNSVIDVDPDLYALLHDIYDEVDSDSPIHLISGHRSEKTNTMLRKQGRKTAQKSQHVLGRAADITIPGVPVSELRDIALEMEAGGVGYYPQSHFIHVDTGRVRQWQGK
jgi:uncharacterized protein YcbK (DUF882 family)